MQQEIRQAAWMLEDAMHDRLVESYPPEPAARLFHFKVLSAEKWYMRSLVGITVLSIFEVPPWCETSLLDFDAAENCKMSRDGHPVFLSGLPYIPIGIGLAIEAALVAVLLYKFIMQYKMEQQYFRPINAVYRDPEIISFGIKMCILSFLDIIVCTYFRLGFRIAFVPRSALLCLLPAVQRLGKCIIKVVGELASIVSFLIGTIVFFAWVAVTIFDDIKGVNIEGQSINTGLDSFGTSIYTMFIAGTTDDFVDCFIPTFVAYRQVGLLWFVFLVVVQLLFLNLVLDTLVVGYMQYAESHEEQICCEQVHGIIRAFKMLSRATGDPDQINRGSFLQFCAALNESPAMRGLTPHTADIIFRAMDTDKSGTMSEDEFCDICGVFQYQFWVTARDSNVKTWAPKFWDSPSWVWFRAQVWNENFNQFMNCILILNFGLVIVESVYDLHNWPEPSILMKLDLVFSIAYVVEVAAKLGVYSFEEYWSETPNQFDFWTTWLLLATCCFKADLKRYANLLRLLRLLRVIKQLKQLKAVQFMSATVQKLVFASQDILLLLGVVVYFFTTLGVQCFGGLFYDGNEALAGSDYVAKRWTIFNFNDTAMSFSLWIVCLLCEYVPDFAQAVALTSRIPGSWLIFLLFYICAVSIIFELVKAFTIEVFMVLHEKKNLPAQSDFEGIEEVESIFHAQGECLHYRAMGDTLRREKLLEVYKEIVKEEGEEGEIADSEEPGEGDGTKGSKKPPVDAVIKDAVDETRGAAKRAQSRPTAKTPEAPKGKAAASSESPGETQSSALSPYSVLNFDSLDEDPDHDIDIQIANMIPRFPDKSREEIRLALVRAKGHAGMAARALSGRRSKGFTLLAERSASD